MEPKTELKDLAGGFLLGLGYLFVAITCIIMAHNTPVDQHEIWMLGGHVFADVAIALLTVEVYLKFSQHKRKLREGSARVITAVYEAIRREAWGKTGVDGRANLNAALHEFYGESNRIGSDKTDITAVRSIFYPLLSTASLTQETIDALGDIEDTITKMKSGNLIKRQDQKRFDRVLIGVRTLLDRTPVAPGNQAEYEKKRAGAFLQLIGDLIKMNETYGD